jgi:hypothetical protein
MFANLISEIFSHLQSRKSAVRKSAFERLAPSRSESLRSAPFKSASSRDAFRRSADAGSRGSLKGHFKGHFGIRDAMSRLSARSCCVDFQMPFFSQVPLRVKAILLKVALFAAVAPRPSSFQTLDKMINGRKNERSAAGSVGEHWRGGVGGQRPEAPHLARDRTVD